MKKFLFFSCLLWGAINAWAQAPAANTAQAHDKAYYAVTLGQSGSLEMISYYWKDPSACTDVANKPIKKCVEGGKTSYVYTKKAIDLAHSGTSQSFSIGGSGQVSDVFDAIAAVYPQIYEDCNNNSTNTGGVNKNNCDKFIENTKFLCDGASTNGNCTINKTVFQQVFSPEGHNTQIGEIAHNCKVVIRDGKGSVVNIGNFKSKKTGDDDDTRGAGITSVDRSYTFKQNCRRRRGGRRGGRMADVYGTNGDGVVMVKKVKKGGTLNLGPQYVYGVSGKGFLPDYDDILNGPVGDMNDYLVGDNGQGVYSDAGYDCIQCHIHNSGAMSGADRAALISESVAAVAMAVPGMITPIANAKLIKHLRNKESEDCRTQLGNITLPAHGFAYDANGNIVVSDAHGGAPLPTNEEWVNVTNALCHNHVSTGFAAMIYNGGAYPNIPGTNIYPGFSALMNNGYQAGTMMNGGCAFNSPFCTPGAGQGLFNNNFNTFNNMNGFVGGFGNPYGQTSGFGANPYSSGNNFMGQLYQGG